MNNIQNEAVKAKTGNQIIIIDDDIDFTESLHEMLLSKDYDVITANDVNSARNKFDEFNPNIVLLDIRLGESNGVELLRLLLEEKPAALCIMLTAYASTDTAIECLRLGAYDYLRKPINPHELFAVLNRCFEKVNLIEEKHTAENLLQESEKKFHGLVTNIPGAVYRSICDKSWTMKYISPYIFQLSGYPAEDFINNNMRSYASIIHPDDVQLVEDKVLAGVSNQESYMIDYRIIHKDGSIRWVYEKGQGVFDDGEVRYLDGVILDNTESHKLSEKLSYQASHDILTDLVNRREFENRLTRILNTARRNKSEHALLYLDLDQFKIVNDTCGHVAGDELLRQLGRLLSNEIRKRDTVARLGGDEFGVLMEHCSLTQAKRVANKLKKAIEQFRFIWETKQFNLGVSIGLVIIDETSGDVTDLLKKADAACYMAKDQGRNRIHIYTVDDKQLVKQYGEMQWVSHINRALEENRFYLVYQPVMPVKRKRVKNLKKRFELLLRMIIDGKTILPGNFMPAAERYGLSAKIDRWVLNTALRYYHENTEILDSMDEISINISGQSINDDEFHGYVVNCFESYKIPQDKICFEITETAAIANLTKANIFIDTLKAKGCKFSLDDFGSGLSSFAYLKTLSVDYLKIDGFFVKDICNDPIDYAMVKSINEIGHEMKLQTIAEFVESKEILDKLKIIGVDYAQGYYFGKEKNLFDYVN